MHNILLQPSYPTTKPSRDEGHDVHYSGGGINFLLEINYAIMNTIEHLQLEFDVYPFFEYFRAC